MIERKSDASFRFGDSEEIKAIKSVKIPARIVGHCTSIKSEVVSKDIPLLLSKKAMKDAKVNIGFVNNEIEIFVRDLDIICSTSGHYCIPIFLFGHIRVSYRCCEHGWGAPQNLMGRGWLKSKHGGSMGELKMLTKNSCEVPVI